MMMEQPPGIPIGGPPEDNALRFEDLTIDDDLPLLDRVVRYCRSGIALQRLVHVKMLAETAESVGVYSTMSVLLRLLPRLVTDPESIIRQHLASQILPLCFTCMLRTADRQTIPMDQLLAEIPHSEFNEEGYSIVTSQMVGYLEKLVSDADMDVRRSASDSLAALAAHIKSKDIAPVILSIPLKMIKKKGAEAEELKIASANLLAELSSTRLTPELVKTNVIPTILDLCKEGSFRVRRSAAQALPRVLIGSSLEDAEQKLIPAFAKLSKDEMYRVRKSTGESLVDMSRSLMILARTAEELKAQMREMRRTKLIPIATKLLNDTNKFVRQGMMQFLGPFIASFYPLDSGFVNDEYSNNSSNNSEPRTHDGNSGLIGVQFFPHANSMVRRLAATPIAAPTPIQASINRKQPANLSEVEKLQQMLPTFLKANAVSTKALSAVISHRKKQPPDSKDIEVVMSELVQQFVNLARISTGDENTDAEMRVYCAYSFPAVVLLLGPENWEGPLKECLMTLINPTSEGGSASLPPPLPVKRCLASSIHTVAHILGQEVTMSDILPLFKGHFFHDIDESVRFNVIRNFPALMSILPTLTQGEYLSLWADMCRGDELLGAHKRSVTNPCLLNWRQRDAVSRSLPLLLEMMDPIHVKSFLWPILKMLLADSVNLVREDAEWSIPVLLRVYSPENVKTSRHRQANAGSAATKDYSKWSSESCEEVLAWLKENILGNATTMTAKNNRSKSSSSGGGGGGGANFSQRQLYCRICASLGLALRLGKGGEGGDNVTLDVMLKNFLHADGSPQAGDEAVVIPYGCRTSEERAHLRRILVDEMLPLALEMKDDKVTNVRLSLMKVLRVMPSDVKKSSNVSKVMKELEDEAATWESFQTSMDVELNNNNGSSPTTTGGGAAGSNTNNPANTATAATATTTTTEARSKGGGGGGGDSERRVLDHARVSI